MSFAVGMGGFVNANMNEDCSGFWDLCPVSLCSTAGITGSLPSSALAGSFACVVWEAGAEQEHVGTSNTVPAAECAVDNSSLTLSPFCHPEGVRQVAVLCKDILAVKDCCHHGMTTNHQLLGILQCFRMLFEGITPATRDTDVMRTKNDVLLLLPLLQREVC